MKVTLVYPPNRNLPSSPYGALPLLAGCLGAAGHRVSIVDANLLVFEKLVERPALEAAHELFQRTWNGLRSRSHLTLSEARLLQGLGNLAAVPFERVLQMDRAARILRDRELFADPDNVNWAYDTLAVFLRAVYSLNPVLFGQKPGFTGELFGYLEGAIDNPVSRQVDSLAVDAILATEPDLVGVCIPFNEQLVEGFALLKQLKARAPGVRTLVGGAIISAYHRELCRDERFWRYADFAMPGEADEAFPQFASALERGSDLAPVPNLWWRDSAGEAHAPSSMSLPNLSAIPAPDFSSIPVGRYFLPETIANYQTSRGCYYGKCTFCSFDIKQNFRFRKAELVCADIEHIQRQSGLKHFIFWDPLTPPRLMKAVAQWNQGRGADQIFWGAETKFEKVFMDRQYTDLLYAGGARFLQFGFESGSQRVLDLMVKGNDLGRVDQMLGALRDSKIAVSVQWFIGFPGETEGEARESFRFLERHRDAVLLSSYMGTYTISPDDDVFQSRGDLYGIDLHQDEHGNWDFSHRDGARHYDRAELHAAYLSRGDAENVTRMGFYVYLTHWPEKARAITQFERGGAIPESWDELAGMRPRRPDGNFVTTFDFDLLTDPLQQGLTEAGGALPRRTTHVAFVNGTQRVYALSERERALVRAADGKHTASELLAATREPGAGAEDGRELLLSLIRRGVLFVELRDKRLEPADAAA